MQEDRFAASDETLFAPANKIGKGLGLVCGN
jgi:hypothetical protein